MFHGQRPPNISPRQYIERIATYSGCSPCCLAMGMKYLDKLREKDAMYELNSLNFHRLVLTATLIASKFVDDFYYSNGYWAKVCLVLSRSLHTRALSLASPCILPCAKTGTGRRSQSLMLTCTRTHTQPHTSVPSPSHSTTLCHAVTTHPRKPSQNQAQVLSHGSRTQVGGVKVEELNGMETEFLFLISFDLHIKRCDYDAFVSELYTRAHATEDFPRRMAGLSIRTSPSGASASAPPWEGPRSPYMIQQPGGGAPPGHHAAQIPGGSGGGWHPWGPETLSPNLQGGGVQIGGSGGVAGGGPQGMLQQQQGGGGVGGGGAPREVQVPSPHLLNGAGVNFAPHMVRFAPPFSAFPVPLPLPLPLLFPVHFHLLCPS